MNFSVFLIVIANATLTASAEQIGAHAFKNLNLRTPRSPHVFSSP